MGLRERFYRLLGGGTVDDAFVDERDPGEIVIVALVEFWRSAIVVSELEAAGIPAYADSAFNAQPAFEHRGQDLVDFTRVESRMTGQPVAQVAVQRRNIERALRIIADLCADPEPTGAPPPND